MPQPVYITHTAAFLPLDPVDNDHMEAALGQAGPRPSRARRVTLRSNGIRSRHYVIDPATGAPRFTNARLAAEAVRALARESGFDLSALACLAAGTTIADQLLPGHGVMVHGELAGDGVAPCEVVTTAGVCCAGAAALKYAWLAVRSGDAPNAVAVASETASLMMRATRFEAETGRQAAALEERPELAFEKDFLRWMLSDASGAFLLQPRPAPGRASLRIDWIDTTSRAHAMPVCMYAGAEKNADGSLTSWLLHDHEQLGRRSVLAIKQDVRLLNASIAVECVEKPLAVIAARRGLRAGDIDWFLPHMSSEYFREPLARALENTGLAIPQERWFTNLATRGNTGSASMHVMVDELLRGNRLRPGQRVLCFVPESGRFSSAYIHLTVV
ncbi:MAG: beta-ketoacyl-ACP synthase III [Opitutaceae bacterium]|jgi:3-oxoacyl-[acyl-carrier-protein] synthase-3|nr:beta-ketoacyl-ACP synthase III [Opitutaceae bacterium]